MKQNAVYVNGIRIGQISQDEYKELRNSIIKDPFVWVYQTLEIIHGVVKIFAYFSIIWAVITFWVVVVIAAKEPEIISIVAADGMQETARSYLSMSFVTLLFVCCVLPILGIQTIRWIPKDRINDSVRHYLGSPANGHVVIYPESDGAQLQQSSS